ncbi:MAG TPA: hypothetical protein DCZ94_00550 [Lentisphaeria bacterium]|nr:MAG: hypothetical protein A2X48_12115 [Lentisphaerae bacterium GWF2_49_21]HBC85421.1 hypothetical protein [Lentisphaeria bacterium]
MMKCSVLNFSVFILLSLLLQSCATVGIPPGIGLVIVEAPVPAKIAQLGNASLVLKDKKDARRAIYLNVDEDDSDADGIPAFADFSLVGGVVRKFSSFRIKLDKKLSENSVTFILDYTDSPPESAKKTSGKSFWRKLKFWEDDKADEGNGYRAPAGFRVWRNNSAVISSRSVKDGGDYLPSGVELYAGEIGMTSNEAELFLEAVPGAEELEKPGLTVGIRLKKDLPFPKSDSSRISIVPVRMQLVTKGAHGEIVPCRRIPLSPNASPVVVLKELTKDDIKVENGNAIFNLQGVVTDPMAETVPNGAADIKSVEIRESPLYSSKEGGVIYSLELKKADAGPKTFWKQFPYKAEFGPVEVKIKLHYGKQIVRAVTSKNSLGFEAYDEVCIECLPLEDGDENAPLVLKIINGTGSGDGAASPYCMRVRGLGNPESYVFSLYQNKVQLVEYDGWFYPGSVKQDYIGIMFYAKQFSSGMEIRNLTDGKDKSLDEFMGKVNGYLKKGEKEEALKMVSDAARKGDPNGEYFLGLFYLNGIAVVKNRKTAFAWFEKAADKDLATAQNMIAYMICEDKGDLEKALKLVGRALEKEPDSGYYLDTAGKILYEMGRYPEALEKLKKANELVPDNAEHQENLGDVLLKLKDKAKAAELWEKALDNTKDSEQKQRLKRKLVENPEIE